MVHVAFHLAEEFISEDLDYYFSGERDKNNQIRPNEDIYSLTPNSSHLNYKLGDGQVGNFFYPSLPNLLDRIYIGISIPLFANNWGAAFLLQLLKALKPGGKIILPVYPEGQAQEKGYWSRSFLENIFLSRQRWTGFSNVKAENDGVMSLCVGRKWPDPIPSPIEWFYRQRANIALEKLLESNSKKETEELFSLLTIKVWENYTHSAIVERILLDSFGAKLPTSLQVISNDFGLLATDILLSPYITIDQCKTYNLCAEPNQIVKNFKSYFSPQYENKHNIIDSSFENIDIQEKSKVICLLNIFSEIAKPTIEDFITKIWQSVSPAGLLVVYEDFSYGGQVIEATELNAILEKLGEVQTYSSIVASKILQDVDISHYSTLQESKLKKEKAKQSNVFRVVQKSS